jgi:hypothetical protein
MRQRERIALKRCSLSTALTVIGAGFTAATPIRFSEPKTVEGG